MNYIQYVFSKKAKAESLSKIMTTLVNQETEANKAPVTGEDKHKLGLKRGAMSAGVGAGASVLLYELAVKRKVKQLLKQNPNMNPDEALQKAKALVGKGVGRTALMAGAGAFLGKLGSDKLVEKSNDKILDNQAEVQTTRKRYAKKHPVKRFIGHLKGQNDDELAKKFMGEDATYIKKHASKEDLKDFYKAIDKKAMQKKLQAQAAKKKQTKKGARIRFEMN